MQTIASPDGDTICRIDQRPPTRTQRLGYSGLIQSRYSPDQLRVWVFGPKRSGKPWRKVGGEGVRPLPDDGSDDLAVMIQADLSRISRRYGRHAEDVAQESFRLIWEGITSDSPPEWIDLDDYKGTLRRAVRRARPIVVFRHVPPPLHQLLALQAPPDSTLYDGPAECFSALMRLTPDLPAKEAALLSVAASIGFDRQNTPAEQWDILGEMLSEIEGRSNVMSRSSVERRLNLSRVFTILGSIIADSNE